MNRPRIALVSCVKKKGTFAAPARDLYVSPLFRGLRRYAERYADNWYILSAKHFVLCPEDIVEPYECTLKAMRKREQLAWAEQVQRRLLQILPEDSEIVLLAGLDYRRYIEPFLRDRRFSVSVPFRGLKFGEQLQILKSVSE